MTRDKREEADPTLASWCVVPPRNQMALLDERGINRTRPFESIVVYEREHTVRVSVGHDKLVPIYEKGQYGRQQTGRETRVFKNYGWIYSYRSGELRVYTSHTSGGHRFINQVTAQHLVAPHHDELNEDIMRALVALWERAVKRGLDVPYPFGDSISQMVHHGAYRMLQLRPWVMAQSLGLGPFLRSRTVQEFTSKAFGRSRYRKDLVKAVAGCENSWQIAVARELVKTVPIDWVISFLKTEQHRLGDYEVSRMLRQPGKKGGAQEIAQAMRHLTVESRRRLLLEDLWDYNVVVDAVRMIRREGTPPFVVVEPDQFPEPGELRKVRSWRELHDTLSAELNALREIQRAQMEREAAERRAREPRNLALNPGNLGGDRFREIQGEPWHFTYDTEKPVSGTIKATKISKALHKLNISVLTTLHVVENLFEQNDEFCHIKYRETVYTVMRAKKTTELADWGTKMHNCIASYAADGIRGDTNLFGIYADGKLVANMEVSNDGMVRQLFGNMNRRMERQPDQKIRSAVTKTLLKAGVLSEYNFDFTANLDGMVEGMGRLAQVGREGYRNLEDQRRQIDRFEGRFPDDAIEMRARERVAGMVIQPQPNGANLVGIDFAEA